MYGEKSILATEVRELQSRVLSLADERDKSLAILNAVFNILLHLSWRLLQCALLTTNILQSTPYFAINFPTNLLGFHLDGGEHCKFISNKGINCRISKFLVYIVNGTIVPQFTLYSRLL